MRISGLASLFVLVCSFATLPSVNAHSWLVCSDYRGDVNNYDESKCRSFPRSWFQRGMNTRPFGFDVDFNHRGGGCQSGSTGDGREVAKYTAGNVYCLAWPTKNHVHINEHYGEDHGLKIFYSTNTNAMSHNEFAANRAEDNFGVHTNGQIDCLGFQRAPKFDEGHGAVAADNVKSDKALGTGCFRVPSNLRGRVVFEWYWDFNRNDPRTPLGELWGTCWDADVSTDNGPSGMMTGFDNMVDTLGAGGQTCKQNWIKAAGSIGPVGGGGGTQSGSSAPSAPAPAPASAPSQPQCNLSESFWRSRQDCGFNGINEEQCTSRGCCWGPNTINAPWCFKSSASVNDADVSDVFDDEMGSNSTLSASEEEILPRHCHSHSHSHSRQHRPRATRVSRESKILHKLEQRLEELEQMVEEQMN